MLCEQDTPVSDGCEMLGGYRQCNGTVSTWHRLERKMDDKLNQCSRFHDRLMMHILASRRS